MPSSDTDVITIPDPSPATPPPPAEPQFTAEDIAKARKEEKDKLYKKMEAQEEALKQFQAEVEALRKAREAEEAEKDAKRQEREAAAKQKAEEEASAKELLKMKEQEWNARFEALQQEQAQKEALLAKEREFLRVQNYIQARVSEERDNIAPELLDFVGGNTEEEVENSLAIVKQKSAAILENIQQTLQQARAGMRGVSPTGYSTTGPMDTEPGTKSFTPEELKNMKMSDYAKYRDSLLGTSRTAQSNRGLYG